MSDQELLELAAKAAGLTNLEYCLAWKCMAEYDDHEGSYEWESYWNPLVRDSDALRLAVNLQLGISIPPVVDGRIEVVTFYGPIISIVEHPQNNDRIAATRRAVVRAAAEIGKLANETSQIHPRPMVRHSTIR